MSRDKFAEVIQDAHPDGPLPTGFEERMNRRLTAEPARPNRRLALGLAAAGACGLVALIAGPLLAPRPAFALKKVQEAVRKVKTVHSVTFTGKLKSTESWYVPGRSRTDYLTGDKLDWTSLVLGTTYYYVYPDRKMYTVDSYPLEASSPAASLTRLLTRIEKSRLNIQIENQGKKSIEGREAEVVKLTLPDGAYLMGRGRERRDITLYIDPKTDLPFRIEKRYTEQGRWMTSLETIGYDESIPESIFAPTFPGLTRKDSKAEMRAGWRTAVLDDKRSRKTNVGATLRYFEAVEALGVMAWFTTDANEKAHVSLSGKGGECPLLAQGVVGESDPALAARYTIQGKRLQWAFFKQTFVAEMGNGDWKLTFANGGNSQTLQPQPDGIGGPTLPQCEPAAEIRKLHPKLAGERNRDRAEYFLDGRWRSDAPLVELALQAEFDPHEQALVFLQLAIEEDGDAASHTKDWQRMADCYEALGEPEKAREYREKK